MDSFFKNRSMKYLLSEVQKVYLADNRPWILGFSGGKDSTCMIQIVWDAISSLPKKKRTKNIFIISSDTLVESPKIVETVTDTLDKMETAPSTTFRWCTDRLKIKSANTFIEERVSEHGEIIMVLGSRKDESSTRANVINAHHIDGTQLSRHSTLPQAFIYSPLKDFTTEDVWNYLLKNKMTPWGTNNRDLLSMYQDANAAECPLVVDTSTSSCGNSRFGCWVCTVVERDRSMENLIDSGELWMEPLLELRQMLKDTQDPEKKKIVRDLKHRNGRVIFWQGRLTMGPYKFEFCKKILTSLLEAQNAVRKNGPDSEIDLITKDEIHEIQRIWRIERGDWKDSAYQIYDKIARIQLSSDKDDMGAFGVVEQEELEKVCRNNDIPYPLMSRALHAEFETQGASRRQKIHPKLEKILAEEWGDMGKAVKAEKRRKEQISEVRD